MKQSVTKLDSFIEDIINYSRNSRTEIEKVDIHFEALVNESLQALKYMEGEHICKINVEVVQMGKFLSDNKRILVNLNNLIGNAIKYHDKSKQNSYVTISIHSDDSKATIKVEDNGIGIAEDKQLKIFEMFYRGTKFSQGSGLGMYIVKETLEKLNGTITLNSKINVGSTFAVSIPNLIENR
jgi:signal transduction histidine kinase